MACLVDHPSQYYYKFKSKLLKHYLLVFQADGCFKVSATWQNSPIHFLFNQDYTIIQKDGAGKIRLQNRVMLNC